jgi:long-subunit fatty acid transport protein
MARIFGVADASKLTLPRGYRNTVDPSFGLALQATDAITLRLGYEARKSSIPQNKFDLTAPMPDITVKSVGLGYQLKEGTRIDLAASYASGTFNVPAEGSCNMNCSNFFNVLYNPYAGLDVSGGIRVRYFGVTLTHPF